MSTARELSDRLASLYRNERNAMADFLIALTDFDARKAWRELGYPSLWAYLRHELKLSKSAAYNRMTAAGLIREYRGVADALRSGELCLSSMAEVARVLTPENAAEVLPKFYGLSHREAEAVSTALRPAAVIPTRDVVRLLPGAAPSRPVTAAPFAPSPQAATPELPRPAPAAALVPEVPVPDSRLLDPPPSRSASQTSIAYLDAERVRISVTVPRRVLDKIEALKGALAHVVPDGDLAGVLERAVDAALAEVDRKRGAVGRPRTPSKPARDDTRHVPAAVKREVWTRSGGRCECFLPNGERCPSRRALQLDHHPRPFALGGKATAEDLRVACRDHNLLGARQVFGDAVMDRYAGRRERVATTAKATAAVEVSAPKPHRAGPRGLALFT